MIDGVNDCIEMLRTGTYNEYIENNLPPKHRIGTICRKDLWNIWPEARKDYFKELSVEEISDFICKASSQVEDIKEFRERLSEMTANDFYAFCSIGYIANKYEGCDKSPKEQYYLHADGRDEGLRDIDSDDPMAFHIWLNDRTHYGGHPWEVCRGGNSTHISLYVNEDERGYYLILAGKSVGRSVETVKFYLALINYGIPVYLNDARLLSERLTEKERIGIVPDGIIPVYCESMFPDENVSAFMNLPYEDRDKFLPFCNWYEEKKIYLISA